MWYQTRASGLLGIQYPILQGPFGGNLSSVELVSTVSNAGGLGGYGAYTLTPQELVQVDQQIKAATDKPYNINLWVSDTDAPDGTITDTQFRQAVALFKPYFDELSIPLPEKPARFQSHFENQVEVILHQKPPVFSFMFGIPDAGILEQCRRLGILTAGAATTLDESLVLEAAGVDLIVASHGNFCFGSADQREGKDPGDRGGGYRQRQRSCRRPDPRRGRRSAWYGFPCLRRIQCHGHSPANALFGFRQVHDIVKGLYGSARQRTREPNRKRPGR
jgi:hypothetical protein